MIIILLAKKPALPSAAKAAAGILALFLLCYFLRAPALASGSAREALAVCASGLIPALFPFLVLTGILNGSGMPEAAAALLGKPIGKLFGLPPAAAYPILMGALGGFPIGAVTTGELYERGALTAEEAERLCCFTNNVSPAYCIGGIGAALYGDAALGVRLYFCQLAAALLIGILQRKPCAGTVALPARRTQPISVLITGAVTNAALTMLKICAFAVFFAVVGDALCLVLSSKIGEAGCTFAAALTELTLAVRRCAASGGSIPLLGFAAGYAGLSVHMQVSAVLDGSGLRLNRYHACKLVQGIVTALLLQLTV